MADFQKIKVGIIGAGTMGSGIAQVAAQSGHETLLFDTDPQMVEKARKGHETALAKLVEKGRMTKEAAEKVLSCIRYITAPHAFEGCGLVIEAVIENLEVKQKLFNDIEKIVEQDCVLATNTSSLSVTSIAT